jgi:hypothetical protein
VNNDYVGSTVCAGCHIEVYRSYRETDMGRSMALASDAAQLEKVPASVNVRNQQLNRNFTVLSRDGAIYQSEYELDPSGAEVFRNTQKLAYVMGSGANAFSYLVQRGEYLFEAPLTYYSRIRKWDLSPGCGRYRIQPSDTCSMCLLPQRTASAGSGQASASGGAMHCISCHDPHVQPRATSIAYFRKKCLGCHSESACKLPLNIRTAQKKQDDCAGCHMPKTPAGIPHSVLTDHRIVTSKDESLPEEAYHLTTPELPDLVHINAVPGKKDQIPPLTLLRAYGELATSDPQYAQSYLKIVDQLAQTNPDDHAVLSALGWREFGRNTPEGNEKAMGYLDRAIKMGSVAPLDYEKLADLLRLAGRPVEAIAILRKGIGVNPYSQRLYKALALVYISEKLYKDAMDAMQKELEIFPEDSSMRMLLTKARATPIP